MPNLINDSYMNSTYLNSRHKERDDQSAGSINNANLTATERAELLRKEREEQKQAEAAQEEAPQKRDFRGLIDRVAEQEAQKAKFSAYTTRQQELLKQVENTITPQSNERSYDFKV
ncbi:hypothetical protein LRP50_19485 [Enterovibrio sp. ZSDZ42]|uniref:Uncharacterized protein n=1 Tax=Enterovibrio gelatinilyticus TaxID=2899819 RepID=A0ABT5R4Y9_9GAMM|nr:hypothetical protein [Enterovibrio sp. ZSDZ42]MDD1795318.1 hypothetical protein [Enterovibrio sp. ZSDZ42]